MPIQDPELFTYLAATGSMCQAARKFAVSPAAVSRQISALEDRLGTQLFYRSTAGLVLLTASGGAFYATMIVREIGRGPTPNSIRALANDNAVEAV